MRLKELLLVLSLPLFFDHVIQAPQVLLTTKAQGKLNTKMMRKTMPANTNYLQNNLKKDWKRIVKNIHNNLE